VILSHVKVRFKKIYNVQEVENDKNIVI